MKQKLIEFITVVSGMRKTIVMVLLVIIGVFFRIKGYLDGNQFVELLKNTVIAFFSANSIEHIGGVIKEYINAKGQITSKETVIEDVDEVPKG